MPVANESETNSAPIPALKIAKRVRPSGPFDFRATADDAWDRAKELAWRLRDRGQTIPWNDVLIGSLALSWGCRVYACDRHFEVLRDGRSVDPLGYLGR